MGRGIHQFSVAARATADHTAPAAVNAARPAPFPGDLRPMLEALHQGLPIGERPPHVLKRATGYDATSRIEPEVAARAEGLARQALSRVEPHLVTNRPLDEAIAMLRERRGPRTIWDQPPRSGRAVLVLDKRRETERLIVDSDQPVTYGTVQLEQRYPVRGLVPSRPAGGPLEYGEFVFVLDPSIAAGLTLSLGDSLGLQPKHFGALEQLPSMLANQTIGGLYEHAARNAVDDVAMGQALSASMRSRVFVEWQLASEPSRTKPGTYLPAFAFDQIVGARLLPVPRFLHGAERAANYEQRALALDLAHKAGLEVQV